LPAEFWYKFPRILVFVSINSRLPLKHSMFGFKANY